MRRSPRKVSSPTSSVPPRKPATSSNAWHTTWNPHGYQKDAVKFLVSRPAAGLLLDPGFGKTAIALHAFLTLRSLGLVRRALVLAKLNICQTTWPDEVAKWNLPMATALLHGSSKLDLLYGSSELALMNYEGLPWLARQRNLRDCFDTLIVDESSKLKDTRTQRFRLLKGLLPIFKRRIIMTGSFVSEALLDIFGQTYVLDMGETFTPYITHFRNAYFEPCGFGGYDWRPRPGAEEQILGKLKPLMLRLPSDLLDMPPLHIVDRTIHLPPGAMRMYKELEDDFIVQLRDGAIVAANAAVAAGKLRQLSGGHIYDERGAPVHFHDAKLDALEELVEELRGSPLLVGYEYEHEAEAIVKRLPGTVRFETGMKEAAIRALVADFNAGRTKVLIGQNSAIAHGLNLQEAAHTVAMYSIPWSLEVYQQLIRRVWRQGQKKHVTVHRLVARDTVDEAVVKGLSAKDATQKSFFKTLEQHYVETRSQENRRSRS